MRPSTIFTSGRTAKACSFTPRSGTLASVPVERFGRSTTTNSSGEASALPPARAAPGACATTSASDLSITLVISLSAPERITMAVSGEPVEVITRRNPSPIDNTPTSTATTPAMPNIAATADPRRVGRLRILKPISAATWANQFISFPPQRLDGIAPASGGKMPSGSPRSCHARRPASAPDS